MINDYLINLLNVALHRKECFPLSCFTFRLQKNLNDPTVLKEI